MKKNLLCIAKKIALLHVIMGGGVCYVLGMDNGNNSNNNLHPNFSLGTSMWQNGSAYNLIPTPPIPQDATRQPDNTLGQSNPSQPSMQQPPYGTGQPGGLFSNNMPNSQQPQYGAGQPNPSQPSMQQPPYGTGQPNLMQQPPYGTGLRGGLSTYSGFANITNGDGSSTIDALVKKANTFALNKKKNNKNNIVQSIQTNLLEIDKKINLDETYKERPNVYNNPDKSSTGGGNIKIKNDTQILSLKISELEESHRKLEESLENEIAHRESKEKEINKLKKQLKTQVDEAKSQIKQGFYNHYASSLLQKLSLKTNTYLAPDAVEWVQDNPDRFSNDMVGMNARVQEYFDVINKLPEDLRPVTQKDVEALKACANAVSRAFDNFTTACQTLQGVLINDAPNQNNPRPQPDPIGPQQPNNIVGGNPNGVNPQPAPVEQNEDDVD